ncbi:DUF6224 family protein [Actinacidiphila oryziradicis]|uniref:Uncharacterized protein n=1 Tax=Actinacidiphila oryziradicis TaxID=2571141 RepID=A0A4U0T900_9ACTN|nr:DUF6224 family protein [Actinacidiphila oryziradicis]TKA12325.1 hypothetical protein FCI23_05770 [Actinacidiphila oryziradicis]
MGNDSTPGFTKEELLLGVALLKGFVEEDEEAVASLEGEGAEDAAQALRGMVALAQVLVYGVIVPRMWVYQKGVSFESTNDVPELNLATFLVDRFEARVEAAHHSPVVLAMSAAELVGLILQFTDTEPEEVPAFLDGIRTRALASMTG